MLDFFTEFPSKKEVGPTVDHMEIFPPEGDAEQQTHNSIRTESDKDGSADGRTPMSKDQSKIGTKQIQNTMRMRARIGLF
jgi:hypothetical protein